MIVLDTNVLSALMRRTPDPEVVAWLDAQPRRSVWTTTITVLEIRFGLQILPTGRRRTALVKSFDRLLLEKLEQRVAPFDTAAAEQAADLMAERHRRAAFRLAAARQLSSSVWMAVGPPPPAIRPKRRWRR